MQPEGITVVGVGRVQVVPDMLVARFGAEVTAQSVQAALGHCSTALAQMIEVLRAAGVPDRDRQTGAARIYQVFDPSGAARGWTASQQVVARLRELHGAGDVVGLTVAAAGDAARLHDLAFAVEDPAEARSRAWDLAYADAQIKAQRYAELAGRQLGVVEAIWETNTAEISSPTPRLVSFASGPPIEAGESEVSAAVGVRWALSS